MSSYKNSGFIASFLCLILLSLAIVRADPYSAECGSVASDIPYQLAVGKITAFNYVKTPPVGFSGGSFGNIHGYTLCRGDVSEDACRICVFAAVNDLLSICPNSQQAFVYYDNCYVIIELGTYSYDSNIYVCTVGDPRADPNLVDHALNYMFTRLSSGAPSQPRYMAAGYLDIGYSRIIYGYVQCLNHLNPGDCKSCLDDITRQLPNTCTRGYLGGRLVAGSCLLRYEIYDFLNW